MDSQCDPSTSLRVKKKPLSKVVHFDKGQNNNNLFFIILRNEGPHKKLRGENPHFFSRSASAIPRYSVRQTGFIFLFLYIAKRVPKLHLCLLLSLLLLVLPQYRVQFLHVGFLFHRDNKLQFLKSLYETR